MVGCDFNQTATPRQWLFLSCFWAAAALGAQDGGVERHLLDRAVASVDGKVITASQLDFEARVLLVNAGGVEAAAASLDDETLRRSLTALIDQRLATLEADKLDAFPVEPEDLERALTSFRGRFPGEARFQEFLERHDAELVDLQQVLRRSLRAQRALEGKLRLKAQITEAEATQYRAAHDELRSVPVDLVRQKLFVQRFQALVREELDQQRRQVDVRLLGPHAPVLERSR
jgi:hypothetical protein